MQITLKMGGRKWRDLSKVAALDYRTPEQEALALLEWAIDERLKRQPWAEVAPVPSQEAT